MLPISFESIKTMAQRMNFVSFDVLEIEDQSIKSHWYRHEEMDLYYFQKEDGTLIKLHVSFLGQIIEWNPLDGTRTGLMVEQEQDGEVFETVHFDSRANHQSVAQSLLIIENASCIDIQLRQELRVLLQATDKHQLSKSSGFHLFTKLLSIFRFNK
jgi:hypothetical protein